MKTDRTAFKGGAPWESPGKWTTENPGNNGKPENAVVSLYSEGACVPG